MIVHNGAPYKEVLLAIEKDEHGIEQLAVHFRHGTNLNTGWIYLGVVKSCFVDAAVEWLEENESSLQELVSSAREPRNSIVACWLRDWNKFQQLFREAMEA